MVAATAGAVDDMHHDIEVTTRRLELEKRRLQRLEKDVATARRAYATKVGLRPPRSARHDSSQQASTAEGSEAGSTGRPQLLDVTARPTSHSIRSVQQCSGASTERGRSLGSVALLSKGTAGEGGDLSIGVGSRGGSQALSQERPGSCKTLVNRLDVQMKKLDSVRHDNTNLQAEINAIRQQRLQLNGIVERLKIEIKQRAAQLADFVEEVEASKDVHNEARLRVAVMRRQRELERSHFKNQVMRLRKDLQNTDHERKEIEVQLKRASEGVQRKKDLIVPAEESGFSESSMMRRIMKTAFLNCIQRRHIRQHQKNIEVFEQAFATIRQSTGISNIEEIVRIFVNLESRNFSLLTYVNHMNREIEALEGLHRAREELKQVRRGQVEQSEQERQEALADLQKQLQATELAMADNQKSCREHRDLLEEIRPLVLQITQRILRELEDIKKAQGALPADDPPRLPLDFCAENLPQWLEWVEQALGKFRDVIPASDKASQEHIFPPTAALTVRNLVPKRQHGHLSGQPPLVKVQELPSSFSLLPDDATLVQKRPHGAGIGLSASQKGEMMDEESEEEDFEKTPLSLKDLRSRARDAAARKRRRGPGGRPSSEARSEDPTGTGTTATPSRGPSRVGAITASGSPTPVPSESPSRKRGGQPGEASPTFEDNGENEEEEEEDSEVDEFGEDGMQALADAPNGADGGVAGLVKPGPADDLSPRSRRAMQLMDASEQPEVTEEELEVSFLRRYKMTREELELMASRMGIHLSNLCFLKQEFDLYDQDRSGYIDTRELRNLLRKLGEEPTPAELEAAFRELDVDGSNEVEFFEFCAWFSSFRC